MRKNKKPSLQKHFFVNGFIYLFPFIVFLLLSACGQKQAQNNSNALSLSVPENEIISNGHRLALTYCQGCHLYPDPALLDTTSWQKVLKAMGYRLGINTNEGYAAINGMERELLKLQNIFPENQLVSNDDWDELKKYYLENAGEGLKKDTLINSEFTTLFNPSFPISQPSKAPLTTLVKFLSDNTLAIGNYENKIKFYSNTFDTTSHLISSNSTPVAIEEIEDEYLLLCIGNIFPNDLGTGSLHQLKKTSTSTRLSKVISENLKRPVYLSIGTLSSTTQKDIVVSNFGYLTGHLNFFKPVNKQFTPYLLNKEPGNGKTLIEDINEDGKNDLLTLRGQGNEGIFAYINQGNNTFSEKAILRFPPVYGSSYFELIDFNNDGFDDIIYTNGDNADYSPILKPYHGIRIFLNKGDFTFSETLFLPLHGASKTISHDFDQDGDLDIAAIAFFPDFNLTPHYGFTYYEQESPLQFVKKHLNEAQQGRWLTMDKGDFDKDGDTDLVLGNFVFSQTPVPDSLQSIWNSTGHEIMFLENNLKNQ